MTNQTWTRYMRVTASSDNDKVIAEKVGVSGSTIGRWRSGEIDPKPRQVVAFARAYGQSPLAALMAAGYLSSDDVSDEVSVSAFADLDDVSTRSLVEELQGRIDRMGDYANVLESISRGEGSPARISPQGLRFVNPNRPPSDVRGQDYVEVLGDRVKREAEIDGEVFYGVDAPYPAGELIEGTFGVGATVEDEPTMKQPPARQRDAARKGRRKADEAPHAE